MKTWWTMWLVGCVALTAAADEVVLFSAATAGSEVWSWEGARLTGQQDGLILSKDKGDGCSVVLEDRFAALPGAVIEWDAPTVTAGSYTLQLLAFKGTTFLGTVDLIKEATAGTRKTFEMAQLALPEGTENVTFKLWISKNLGSSVLIKELKYALPVTADRILYDAPVGQSREAQTDQASWQTGPQGGTLTLADGASYGSIVFTEHLPRPESGGTLVIQVAEVKSGTLTAQACLFDGSGLYIDSLDLAQRATSTLSIPLSSVAWPESGRTFQVKLWLGGGTQASAVIQRILLLK